MEGHVEGASGRSARTGAHVFQLRPGRHGVGVPAGGDGAHALLEQGAGGARALRAAGLRTRRL